MSGCRKSVAYGVTWQMADGMDESLQKLWCWGGGGAWEFAMFVFCVFLRYRVMEGIELSERGSGLSRSSGR